MNLKLPRFHLPNRADLERGVSAVEYAIIIALISITIVPVVGLVGGNLTRVFADAKVAFAEPATQHDGPWEGCTWQQMDASVEQAAAADPAAAAGREDWVFDWNTCQGSLKVYGPTLACSQAQMDQAVADHVEAYRAELAAYPTYQTYDGGDYGSYTVPWAFRQTFPMTQEQQDGLVAGVAETLGVVAYNRANPHGSFDQGWPVYDSFGGRRYANVGVDWDDCTAWASKPTAS